MPATPTVNLSNGSSLSGTAEPGSTVILTDGNGNPIAEVTADSVFGGMDFGGERYFPYPCDALVLNGYLGSDGVRPFLPYLKGPEAKNIFIVVKSSNKSSPEVQDLISGDRVIHTAMADLTLRWSTDLFGKCGYGEVGAVVGLSSPRAVQALRKRYDTLFFLVPGALGEAGLEALNGRPLFIESPVQRRRAEEICRSYGIVPSETRYAGSYFVLDTLIGREGGFAIDSKMVPYGTEGAEIVYLPVRRAFHDKAVLAWRREKHAPAAEDFAAFLRPGDGELSSES